MEKEFIPYEQALALKELGFDEPCVGFYNIRGLFVPDYKVTKLQIDNLRLERCCLAPTYSQVSRWFREKYDLDYSIKPVYGKKHYMKYRCNIYSNEQLLQVMKYYFPDNPYFDNREEAEIECLKKLIEIVKNK
jgi:hypothetical protein